MKLDVSMTADKEEFNVASWWAKAPEFALAALSRQLMAASVVWPELASYEIVRVIPEEMPNETAPTDEPDLKTP